MNLIEQWSLAQLRDIAQPRRLIATPEPNCNLACEHCYFAHTKVEPQREDWSKSVAFALDNDISVLCAGRIITDRVVRFIKSYLQEAERRACPVRLSIVDNGFTIFRLEEFFDQIEEFNISIDGSDASHDRQRNKQGAALKAWEAVYGLKRNGYDPLLSCCLSPLTINGWKDFEDMVEQADVRMSVSLTLQIGDTRASAMFTDLHQREEALELLLTGIPKLVQIYDTRDLKSLKQVIGGVKWQQDESLPGMSTTLDNGVRVIYRPLSISYLTEFFVFHEGNILGHVRKGSIQELNMQECLEWAS